jgi:hypothetical protein
MRRRYIAVGNKWVEVTSDYVQPASKQDHVLWNPDRGYENLKSPIDGADISSRSKHREYMKANGLCTIDDMKGVNSRNQAVKEAYRQGHSGTGAVQKEHIARAIAELERKRR